MKNNFLIIIFCTLLISCSERASDKLVQIEDLKNGLPVEKICELSNYPNLLGELSSFHFVNEGAFLVSAIQPPMVLLFDNDGEQLQSLGRQGRGQFEYLSPSRVRSYDGLIYVWCNQLMKLIAFTEYGEAVREYLFSRSIKDFAIHNNLMFVYKVDDKIDRRIISVYDLEREEFLAHNYGHRTNEHDILNSSACTGAMLIDGENLYFAPSDRTKLYKIHLSDLSVSEFFIEAPGFTTKSVKQPMAEFMQDVYKSIQYLFGSDVVTSLHRVSGKIVLMAETGEIELQGLDITDYSNRRMLFYVLDNDNKLSRAFRAAPFMGTNSCLYASYGDRIYNLRLSDNLQQWELFSLDVF